MAKCLTICQPWAWAIIHGTKRIENRRWYTPYRGPLLIHAGKSRDWMSESSLADIVREEGRPVPVGDLDYGAIVGRCNLIACRRPHELPGTPYVEGPWCWVLADVEALDRPVPWRGERGLFDVQDDFEEAERGH